MSQSYRLKLSRPSLKLRVATRIPAQLVGGDGITITRTNGVYTIEADFGDLGDLYQPLDATLTALAALDSTAGLLVQTAADAFTKRTLTGTANEITVADGDGVSADPTLSLPAAMTFTGKTVTGGTFSAPTITGGTHTAITSLGIRSTGAAFDLTFASTEVLTAGRTLTVTLNDAARTLNMGGNITTAGALTTSGAFASTFTMTGATTVTFPTTGTLATLAGAEALTNKTINLASNTLTGTTAQFNTALSDGDFATLAGTEELTNKTLAASVAKGIWTASGTWTIPAVTLGGTVSGGGNQINNVIIGSSTPLAGSFTTLAASASITLTNTQSNNTQNNVTNASTGTAALATHSSTNSNGISSVGVGGSGYTGIALLQNRGFLNAQSALDGIAINNEGADPIVFGISNAEVGRFSGTTAGQFNLGVSGTLAGALQFQNATSGTSTIQPAAGALGTGVATLPAGTYTIVGDSSTATLTNKTFNSAGTGNTLQVSGVTISRGQYPGTNTNDSATAGNKGEYVESVLASGSAVSLTTGGHKTITSISLTAGDWDVHGVFQSVPANTTVVSQFAVSYSLTTDTLDTTAGRIVSPPMNAKTYDGATGVHIPGSTVRFSLSGTTTIYLVGFASFTTSTCTAFGLIRARRLR
jgi:hypothetical protein